MRILFLAPQPFYQERGTPIAVDLVLQVLSAAGHQIDLITYAEGRDREYPAVEHERVGRIGFLRSIPPGYSWKKIVASGLMLVKAIGMVRRQRYDLVHAVEEGVFMALLLRLVFRLPYVYDMDSSLAEQLVEKKSYLKPFLPIFHGLEGLAIRRSRGVLPVCRALEIIAIKNRARTIQLLPDISLSGRSQVVGPISDIKKDYDIKTPLILYVGNLERYQGVDLLLEAFAVALKKGLRAHVALIGGAPGDVEKYRKSADASKFHGRVHVLGPRPVSDVEGYLAQADILASPRIKGKNTPMKIYTYLDSGKPLLATRIESHTQVLSDATACLVEPDAESMSQGMLQLAGDEAWAAELGEAGRAYVAKYHRFESFAANLNRFYEEIQT